MLSLEDRPVVVLTDVHLGYHKNLDELLALLRDWADPANEAYIVIGGDFLDLWRAEDNEVRDVADEAIGLVARLAQASRVSYVVGNHDFRLRRRVLDNDSPWEGEVDFAALMGLTPANTCHRYFAFGKDSQRWIVCHGDETDFGYTVKQIPVLGRRWRDVLTVLYMTIDQQDSSLSHAYDAAIRQRFLEMLGYALIWVGREALQPRSLTWTDMSAIGDRAPAVPGGLTEDELLERFAEGVAHYVAQPRANAAELAMLPAPALATSRLSFTGADVVDLRAMGLLPTAMPATVADAFISQLADVPGKVSPCTEPDNLCYPPGEVAFPPQYVIIGHRHQPEEYPNTLDPRVIDCGSWEAAYPCGPTYLLFDDDGPRLEHPCG